MGKCSALNLIFKIKFLMLFSATAVAQISSTQAQTISLDPVFVEEDSGSDVSLLGFQGFELREIPVSAQNYSEKSLEQNQVRRLADLTTLEASLSDSYNATGYWDMVAVRGYTLDNRNNFRRNGLPVNVETSIPVENKSGILVLKGLAGVQSGVSSPGGLINYETKKATSEMLREFSFSLSDSGGLLAAADVGDALTERSGFRINLAQEHLSPHLKDAKGDRTLVAGAFSVRVGSGGLLDAELESSHRAQPSQPGMSLLGSNLPNVADPNINLNNQTWSQPVGFEALSGSLRYVQAVNEDLEWSLAFGVQSLKNDDYLAYPYGCTKEGVFDRYCSDGTFDFYDYRSENELRDTEAVRTGLGGKASFGDVKHNWNLALMGWKTREGYQRQAYNLVGEGNVDGTTTVPANPTLNDESTNRDSKNLQFAVTDAMELGNWTGWLGASWNGINRSSVRTDGSRATDFYQSFILPWAALSYQWNRDLMIYGSYSEGMEAYVVPNRNSYSNPGEYLPDVRSRQYELGVRGGQSLKWNAAVFDINRPLVTDQAPLYQVDGEDHHLGLEVELRGKCIQCEWYVAAMLLEARRENSSVAAGLNGKAPVNVPKQTVRSGIEYHLNSLWSLKGRGVFEGERAVTADNSIVIPGWIRWDAGVGFGKKLGSVPFEAQLIVENLLDSKYWRESPTQYGHMYLYPGSDRTVILNMQATL
ncbi:TonB-dependent siderophore receptor [Bdellovibrio sp. HCB290]|uniref:TonB-dependent siderophore receptor n=1 Tax=Bdellovibrio sp. HCB290 TaxID=3394356 RepID=UPI0039B5F303